MECPMIDILYNSKLTPEVNYLLSNVSENCLADKTLSWYIHKFDVKIIGLALIGDGENRETKIEIQFLSPFCLSIFTPVPQFVST